jgi:hypothetical protein
MKIMNVGGNKKPERWRSGTTRLVVRPEVTIVVFLMAVMLFKLKLMRPAATGPIFFAVVQHDAAILALILLLYAAGAAAARKNNGAGVALGAASTLSKLSMAASLVVALLYATDAFAYYFFDTRLYASDIVTFSSEPRAALSLLRSGWWVISGYPVWKLAIIAAAILLLLRAYYLLLAKPLRDSIARARSGLRLLLR